MFTFRVAGLPPLPSGAPDMNLVPLLCLPSLGMFVLHPPFHHAKSDQGLHVWFYLPLVVRFSAHLIHHVDHRFFKAFLATRMLTDFSPPTTMYSRSMTSTLRIVFALVELACPPRAAGCLFFFGGAKRKLKCLLCFVLCLLLTALGSAWFFLCMLQVLSALGSLMLLFVAKVSCFLWKCGCIKYKTNRQEMHLGRLYLQLVVSKLLFPSCCFPWTVHSHHRGRHELMQIRHMKRPRLIQVH